MHRTIIIRREFLNFVPKYQRYEKRHKNLAAHVSPAFRVEEGDWVTVGQCRPLSKTVREIHPIFSIFCAAELPVWFYIRYKTLLPRSMRYIYLIKPLIRIFRSASTPCVSCPAPARPSRRSASSKRREKTGCSERTTWRRKRFELDIKEFLERGFGIVHEFLCPRYLAEECVSTQKAKTFHRISCHGNTYALSGEKDTWKPSRTPICPRYCACGTSRACKLSNG